MTTLREAAQQALEALGLWATGRDMDAVALNDLIFRLEDALAQPQKDSVDEYRKGFIAGQIDMRDREQAEPVQEPVAWMIYTEGGTSAYVTDNPNDLVGAYRALALYTAPPQRKPLTDEEIQELSQQHKFDSRMEKFVRIIERAHGIGGTNESA